MGCNQSKVAPFPQPEEGDLKFQKKAPKIAGWQRFKAFWRRNNKVQPLVIKVQPVTSQDDDAQAQTAATENACFILNDRSTPAPSPQTEQAPVATPTASHTSLAPARTDEEANREDANSHLGLGSRPSSPSPCNDADIEYCVQPVPDLTVTGIACSSAPSSSTKVGGGAGWRHSPADRSSAPAAGSSTQQLSSIIASRQARPGGISYEFFDPRDGFGVLKNPPVRLSKLKTRKQMTDEERVNNIKNKMEIARQRRELIQTEMNIKLTEQGLKASVNQERAYDLEAHKSAMAHIKLQAKHQRWEVNQGEQKLNQMEKTKERQRRHLAVQETRRSLPNSPCNSPLPPPLQN